MDYKRIYIQFQFLLLLHDLLLSIHLTEQLHSVFPAPLSFMFIPTASADDGE